MGFMKDGISVHAASALSAPILEDVAGIVVLAHDPSDQAVTGMSFAMQCRIAARRCSQVQPRAARPSGRRKAVKKGRSCKGWQASEVMKEAIAAREAEGNSCCEAGKSWSTSSATGFSGARRSCCSEKGPYQRAKEVAATSSVTGARPERVSFQERQTCQEAVCFMERVETRKRPVLGPRWWRMPTLCRSSLR